jgi:hypothetical protein
VWNAHGSRGILTSRYVATMRHSVIYKEIVVNGTFILVQAAAKARRRPYFEHFISADTPIMHGCIAISAILFAEKSAKF